MKKKADFRKGSEEGTVTAIPLYKSIDGAATFGILCIVLVTPPEKGCTVALGKVQKTATKMI